MPDENTPPTDQAGDSNADKLRIAELEQQLEERDARLADKDNQLAGSRSKADDNVEKRLASAEAEIQEYKVRDRESDIANLADDLMEAGTLTPAEKDNFVSFARQVHGSDARKVRLANGAEQQPEQSPWEQFVKLCSSMQQRFELNETPGLREKPKRPGSPVETASSRSAETREQRISDYMEKHGVSRSDAIAATAGGLRAGEPARRKPEEVA